MTALDALDGVPSDRFEHHAILAAEENARLRLEVFHAEVRHKNVFGQLLLQFLFDLVPEAHVNLRVVGVQLGEDDDLEAANDALLRQLQRFRDAQDLFVWETQRIKVVPCDELLPLATAQKVLDRAEEATGMLPDQCHFNQVHSGLELVTRLLDRELDARFIDDIMVVDHLKESRAETEALIRW